MFPEIRLTESVHLPTYLLIISLTYCWAIFWIVRRAEKLGYDRSRALDLCLVIMIAGFLGARLFHVFYEAPEFYWKHPTAIFKIWYGGYVFYGGAIAAGVAAWIYLKRKKESFGYWADLFAPVAAFGYGVGRLACFFNGCCYGDHCDLPWGVAFPNLDDGPRHPTQLYATLWEFSTLGFLLLTEKILKPMGTHDKSLFGTGFLFWLWLSLHSVGRIVMEVFRADDRGALVLGLSVSTVLSLALLVLAVGSLVRMRSRFIKS